MRCSHLDRCRSCSPLEGSPHSGDTCRTSKEVRHFSFPEGCAFIGISEHLRHCCIAARNGWNKLRTTDVSRDTSPGSHMIRSFRHSAHQERFFGPFPGPDPIRPPEPPVPPSDPVEDPDDLPDPGPDLPPLPDDDPSREPRREPDPPPDPVDDPFPGRHDPLQRQLAVAYRSDLWMGRRTRRRG